MRGQGYALKLTAAGLKAIAVDEGAQDATEHSDAQPKNGASPDEDGHPARVTAPRDGSKLARVIDLLQRSDGATVPNLTEATGWLPYTKWAALTGLRKRIGLAKRQRRSAMPLSRGGRSRAKHAHPACFQADLGNGIEAVSDVSIPGFRARRSARSRL